MKHLLAVIAVAFALAACTPARADLVGGPSPVTIEQDSTAHADRATATLATSLRFYWTEEGGRPIILPQVHGTVLLPLNSAGTLRAEGLDDAGHVVPLFAPEWTGSGTWYTVAGNGLIATITPIEEGPYDPILLNADADSTHGEVPIWGLVQIRVVP